MRRADNQIQFLETAAGAQEQPGQRRRTRFALVFARLLFTHAIYSGWRVHSAWCILFSEARSVLEYRLPVLEDWSSTKWLGLDKVQAKEKVVWAKFAGRRKVIATYMRAFSGGIATYMRDTGLITTRHASATSVGGAWSSSLTSTLLLCSWELVGMYGDNQHAESGGRKG